MPTETQGAPPAEPRPPLQPIVTRLLRVSFYYYVALAVALTALLVLGEFVAVRAQIGREMTTYEKVFRPALAEALWTLDHRKLEAVVAGMVELHQVAGVRIGDPVSGRSFLVAIDRPDQGAMGSSQELEAQWRTLADQAVVRHGFDISYRHATGTSVVGHVELIALRDSLVARVKGQSALIIAISLFKEAILWGIIVVVGTRLLVRPLRHLIASIHGVNPDDPGHVALPASSEHLVRGTELAAVRDSFNELIDQVQEGRRRLVAFNAALEGEVAQRTESLARANRELEEQGRRLSASNAELEQFAYVASHDLRQPLRMVSGYMGLIRRRLGGQSETELSQLLEFAEDGAKRMDRLITDLLDYSRIGRDDLRESWSPVVLDDIIAESIENLGPAIRDAEATVSAQPGMPTIRGNPIELMRLFQNLIGNAVTYRHPERRPEVRITWILAEGSLDIAVADNGMGIAPEDRQRVFGVFQRLVSREQHEGTGIGLAVCKRVVEHHGGRIWIDGGEAGGSVFHVALPAQP